MIRENTFFWGSRQIDKISFVERPMPNTSRPDSKYPPPRGTGRQNPRMGGQWGETERLSQPVDPGGVGGLPSNQIKPIKSNFIVVRNRNYIFIQAVFLWTFAPEGQSHSLLTPVGSADSLSNPFRGFDLSLPSLFQQPLSEGPRLI